MWYMEFIPDFIYLNNGELNWDAISTIFNSILVLSLILITFWYSSEVKKQTNLMKKANERIIVLDCIKNFLYPCLNKMENNIQNINNYNFYWNQSNGKSQISHIFKITDSKYVESFAKTDVFKKHRELEALCSEYDKLLDEIIQVHDEIKRAIENTADKDCLKCWVQKYIQKRKIDLEEATTDPVHHFIQGLVNYNNIQENDNLYGNKTEIEFLKFDENIINCIDTREYNEIDEVRYGKINQFKEKIEEIIEKFSEKIDCYRQDYHISEDEMKKF